MAGITYTGDSVYHAVRGEYATGTHILVKIELKEPASALSASAALQRNIGYGVDSAVETVKAFRNSETDWMWGLLKYFVIEKMYQFCF